uniref:Cytochrome c biogenesis protein n=1 Tax=Phaeostrophion irregulare TaxID=243268 RepID=UPI002E784DD7|nr:Cytochrome c biogenesis protein [Phaeostrophion irregulare]WAM64344.1 Cytochrome c biogenesis protein [Phaeostrophion irregulare]
MENEELKKFFKVNVMKKFFKFLANLKLAILILLVIATISGIGSIIEQNKNIEFYQLNYSSKIFSVPFWKIILLFNFNNIYNTWWFLFLLLLLGLSLLCCTIIQQLPTLKFSRRYYFYKQFRQFNKLNFKINKARVFQSHLSYSLIIRQYSLFQQHNTLYAYKGLISRVGPIVVHLSIICILLGSALGALTGFNSQEIIPKTELFHIQNPIKNGLFSNIPQQAFRINDFWTTHAKTGQVKQFYSDISVLNYQGFELNRKTISVNNPLLINELIIYQTDWSILGIRLNITKKNLSNAVIQLPILKVKNSNQKIWISSLPNGVKSQKNFILLIKNNRGQLSLYSQEGKFLNNINIGENINNINFSLIRFIDIISSTGIQIKADPGVKLIYFGFLFLIISSLISYISFSEFWLSNFPKKVSFGGKTNRAKVKFNVEFLRCLQSFIE